MSSYKEPDLEERQSTTAKAKKAMLEKFVQPPEIRLWRSDKLPEWR